MKLKKEKKKVIAPFHHRPLLQQDTPEPALKCYAVMATKGLPTVNSLTNDSQKRFSDCAGSAGTAKKYAVPNSFNKHSTSLGTTEGTSSNKLDINKTETVALSSKTETVLENTSKTSFTSQALQEKSNYRSKKPAQNSDCYLLPGNSSLIAPALPGNTLDCRLFQPLPSPPPLQPHESSKPILNDK